jgi:hypothetical protein
MLIGLNGSGEKGALLFGMHIEIIFTITNPGEGIYILGTFGSALSTIYAYNSSNTSGHTVSLNRVPIISLYVSRLGRKKAR